ncbi:MAG: malate dehydrogenase [Nitrososphaerota archaeon]|jgi:malate dehydrogenase|nr:malate dehydrogenase [Nitrososphaerota archaeon]
MITIIGAGRVGSAAAFEILRYKLSDVVLIDTNLNQAKGEALDMMQASPALEFDGTIEGTNDFSQMQDSELVIVTAGVARKPGMSRIDLMNTNAKIIRSISKNISKYASDSKLMIVTNPVDIMTYLCYSETNFAPNHIFGMGNILDTMRFRSHIASELNVSREDTRALVIGEHGDFMVPLVEYASVSGIPLTNLLATPQIEKIIQKTINSGSNVIKLKGNTAFAPASAIALMANAIITGRNRVMSVSTCLKGQYGQSNLSIGIVLSMKYVAK